MLYTIYDIILYQKPRLFEVKGKVCYEGNTTKKVSKKVTLHDVTLHDVQPTESKGPT